MPIYNDSALDQIKDSVFRQILDQNETLFFKQQLTAIKQTALEVLYPEIRIRSFLPVDSSTSEGDKNVTYKEYDVAGKAKIISDYSADSPNVTTTAREVTSRIKSIGAHFVYSVDDIRYAQRAGINLNQRDASATAQAIFREEEEIACFGDTANGLNGLFNHTGISEYTLPSDGTGSSKAFSTKTGEQIIRDVTALLNLVTTETRGIHRANTFLAPVSVYSELATRPRSSSSDLTILAFLRQAFPGVAFDSYEKLSGRGAGSTNRIFAYERSPLNAILESPMGLTEHAPERQNYAFKINYELKTGGAIVYRPKANAFADGA